jgi:tRNA dimethylallyltransferase
MCIPTSCDKVETATTGLIIPKFEKQRTVKGLAARRVIVLAGPTGVGKTPLSLTLAQALGGEVVSADSVQVYRGMDIGTAKATVQERAQVPHHLIDLVDVTQPFNVVDFFYEATRCLDMILARGRVPIVVGGSGFWIHALLYGPPSGPAPDPELRSQLNEALERLGIAACYERLQKGDPEYAATVSPNDRAKIIRGLEILTLTGRKVSDFAWRDREVSHQYQFHCWFLDCDRYTLYPRLNQRCEQMVANGLIEEVRRLDAEGLRTNPSAARAIGYRQTLEFLETEQSPDQFRDYLQKFQSAMRHYAKRQWTWFRREPLFEQLDGTKLEWPPLVNRIADEYQSRI